MANDPAEFIWMDGEYVAWPDAKIHVDTDTVLRGGNVFEGLRAYYNPDERQAFIFRLEEHLDRLWLSMKVLRMGLSYSKADLAAACTGLVAKNGFHEDLQIRVIAYFGKGPLYAFEAGKVETGAFIIASPRRSTMDDQRGIACSVSAWRRLGDNVMPPRVKAGANYLQSRLVAAQAHVDGYDGAIILNDRDKVAEGPGACLMMVRDGRPITPPVTAGILESITRSTLIELFTTELKLPLTEREIDRTELYIADEAFFCGSAFEVTPITSVDRFPLGDGKIGPVTQQIRKLYHDIVRGKMPKYKHWLTPVY
jgi:branched-chain amino acid aminotransferase